MTVSDFRNEKSRLIQINGVLQMILRWSCCLGLGFLYKETVFVDQLKNALCRIPPGKIGRTVFRCYRERRQIITVLPLHPFCQFFRGRMMLRKAGQFSSALSIFIPLPQSVVNLILRRCLHCEKGV